MVTRTGNKANLVLVAGRIVGDRQGGVVGAKAAKLLKVSGLLWLRMVGVNGPKFGGEVEVAAGLLDRRPPRWSGWCQGCCQAATGQWVALGKAREQTQGDWCSMVSFIACFDYLSACLYLQLLVLSVNRQIRHGGQDLLRVAGGSRLPRHCASQWEVTRIW